MKFKNLITLKMAIAICGGLPLLTACSSDEPSGTDNDPVAARITANIASTSRAIGTTWQTGDKIGITTTGNLKQYTNIEYTTAEGNGIFTGTPIYFQDAASEVTFTAYYPFAGTEGTADWGQPGRYACNAPETGDAACQRRTACPGCNSTRPGSDARRK